VKLSAAALVVSLIGCAGEQDGEGGAFMDGLRPAKPSLDDPGPPGVDINPAVGFVLSGGAPIESELTVWTPDGGQVTAETIEVPFPIEGLCSACTVIVLRDARNPAELNVVDIHGHFFCRLWTADDGHLVSTDCR
jgi:hypothetical protein